MTIALPDLDTDLSRVLLEDLAPPCEVSGGCDKAAVWAATVTNTVCGCRFMFLLCDHHKNEVLKDMADPAKKAWICTKCGMKWGPCAYADDMNLELEKL